MKIDVCIVTKTPLSQIKGLEHIPVNNLIIETSTPLALARMRAIQKVKSKIFAFIDDDVELDESWFETLIPYFQDPTVGAVQGILSSKGFGSKWDKALKNEKVSPIILKFGQRGFTHNTLIKTESVKDWIPDKDLSAWEDYDLTVHIMNKKLSWIRVSTDSYHCGSWRKIWKNASWGIKGRKVYFPSRRDSFIQIFRKLIWTIRVTLSLKIHWRVKLYRIYFNMATIWAHMKWLFGRL